MDFDYTFEVITPDNTGSISIGGTGALVLPNGTTAQRPAVPSAGMMRFNTTISKDETYDGTTWQAIASEAFVLANSAVIPVVPAHSALIGPLSGSATATFRTIALGSNDLSDVVITSPTNNQILMYDGTDWVNNTASPTSISGLLSGWVSLGNGFYYSDFLHNLGTKDVVIMLYNNTTGAVIEADSILLSSTTVCRITVYGNSTAIRIVVIANGLSAVGGVSSVNGHVGSVTLTPTDIGLSNVLNTPQVTNAGGAISLQEDVFANRPAAGNTGALFLATDAKVLYRDTGSTWDVIFASSGTVRTLTFFANSLDSPNTADFAVNALAPTISDPANTALNVRSFSNTIEQGVCISLPIPTGAVNVTFRTKAKAQTAPAATAVVQNRLYIRSINNNSAIGSWSAATDLTSVAIPTNTYYQFNSQTFTLASLGLTTGGLYQVEFTRKISGVTGGTNLAYPWLLVSLDVEFT